MIAAFGTCWPPPGRLRWPLTTAARETRPHATSRTGIRGADCRARAPEAVPECELADGVDGLPRSVLSAVTGTPPTVRYRPFEPDGDRPSPRLLSPACPPPRTVTAT